MKEHQLAELTWNMIPVTDLTFAGVGTTLGPLPIHGLDIQTFIMEDDKQIERATEYRYKGDLVKRSVHVYLKG